MIVAMVASIVLVVTTILILYEMLRLTSNHLAELPLPPRARIIVVVLASFAGHTAAVWTYAFAYWVLAVKWRISGFAGLSVGGFQDCLYFSVVTYTSRLRRPRACLARASDRRGRGAQRALADRLVRLIHLSCHGALLAAARHGPSRYGETRTVPCGEKR